MSDLQKLLEDGETQKALALVNEDDYAWEDLLGLLEGSDEDMQRSAFEIVSKRSAEGQGSPPSGARGSNGAIHKCSFGRRGRSPFV